MGVRGPVGGLGLAGVPFGEGEEVAVFVCRWAEKGLIRFAGGDGVLERIVDAKDLKLGTVFTVVTKLFHSGEAQGQALHCNIRTCP